VIGYLLTHATRKAIAMHKKIWNIKQSYWGNKFWIFFP
jgi:hypothetical protein